jgi:hypothetical protein
VCVPFLHQAIVTNDVMTAINLTSTHLMPEGGQLLAAALERNDVVVMLEVGTNNLTQVRRPRLRPRRRRRRRPPTSTGAE